MQQLLDKVRYSQVLQYKAIDCLRSYNCQSEVRSRRGVTCSYLIFRRFQMYSLQSHSNTQPNISLFVTMLCHCNISILTKKKEGVKQSLSGSLSPGSFLTTIPRTGKWQGKTGWPAVGLEPGSPALKCGRPTTTPLMPKLII